ncbi:hypothetical protein RJ639_041320 [Escallonia herrerae]|uniref:DUF7148 domain-containing protein n=1 Tax=Escallonia herrerae TaxID=1293975 RepID=A0AA88WGJ0_9ASTE|nr:hypothetical protein RJ639_041320 [Escallonia herrerae]
MATVTTMGQLFQLTGVGSHVQFSPFRTVPRSLLFIPDDGTNRFARLPSEFCSSHQNLVVVPKASLAKGGVSSAKEDDEDGVSLGTMKLPLDTDVPRFESLLFQWGNSLCQGANLPLPMPLKVDKILGGARLGFITIGDGNTEVLVYIDCLVYPATGGSGPFFRAVRNGPLKDKSPPGEPRIMESLLQALKKCVQIARV